MSENDATNVTQVLKAFQRFLLSYENPLWAKNASVEDIKSTFKLGNFIEKTISTFKAKHFSSQFVLLLEIWGKKNCLKSYSEEFFTLANDHLLGKIFKYPNIKENTLDIGVRVYTSLYPKERFRDCLKNLILSTSSLKAITNFVNHSLSDKSFIENSVVLGKWSEYCRLGLKNDLKSKIDTYLSLYNVEEKLPRLISMLALTEKITNEQSNVQTLVLECLLNKMVDRSLLSKTFWLTLFHKVNLHHTSLACKNHPMFLEYLLNFIEYIGGMMVRDSSSDLIEWTSDRSVSFCHEISYFEVVIVLKLICCEGLVKKIVLERIENAKEYSNAELWNQIINDLS